jgi:hypothetical protein
LGGRDDGVKGHRQVVADGDVRRCDIPLPQAGDHLTVIRNCALPKIARLKDTVREDQ